jgi:hypothetical protein
MVLDRHVLAFDVAGSPSPLRNAAAKPASADEPVTNPKEYLRDPTGARRFWPVAVTKYNREEFLKVRDQIYAEAVACEPDENLWLDDKLLETEHEAIAETRRVTDALEDKLAELRVTTADVHKAGKDEQGRDLIEERVSSNRVYEFLELKAQNLGPDMNDRIKTAMHKLKWEGPDNVRFATGEGRKTKVLKGYWRVQPVSSVQEEKDEIPF